MGSVTRSRGDVLDKTAVDQVVLIGHVAAIDIITHDNSPLSNQISDDISPKELNEAKGALLSSLVCLACLCGMVKRLVKTIISSGFGNCS
jgi:hypothetical protein